MKENNRILNVFASVSGLIIVDKIVGFIKQMLVASTLGATTETDIINLSQNAVSDIQYILAQALITAFVSIYIHTQQGKCGSVQRSKTFAGDAIKAFGFFSLVLSVALFVFAHFLAKVLAPSYSTELSNQLTRYIRIYSLIVILFTLICIFRAILSANKNFIPEQLVSFNQSVITIVITILLSSRLGAKALVVSFFAFTVWNSLYLGFLCRKHIFFNWENPLNNPNIKELLKMIGPLLLGYSLIYVNQMVDRMLVSGLGPGVITALSYGSVLSNLITTFIMTFCTIIFSYITSAITAGNYSSASMIVEASVKMLSVIFMPITITFVLCSKEIVSIVYGRGAFDENAVISASLALKGYAIMFIPVVLREIYSRYQYAFQDSKRPMINGSIGILGNILFSIILCHFWGVYGVALATSISVLISAVLNMITAREKSEMLSYSFLNRFGVKFIVVTFLCGAVGYFAYNTLLECNAIIKLMAVFTLTFLFFLLFFGKEVFYTIKKLKNMIKIST